MAEANSQGRPKQTRKRSGVWNHFTEIVKFTAKCNHCQSELKSKYGTNSLWKHLVVKHFTTLGEDEQGDRIVRCTICSIEFKASDNTLFNHVMGCIERQDADAAAAAGASSRPDFWTRLISGPDAWPGKAWPSLSLGTAETIEKGKVVYLACHLIDNQWNLHRMVTDAYAVVPSQEAVYESCMERIPPRTRGGLGLPYMLACGCGVPSLGKYVVKNIFPDYKSCFERLDWTERLPFMVAFGIPRMAKLAEPENSPYKYVTAYPDNVFHSIANCFSPCLDLDSINHELLSDHGLEDSCECDERWCSRYCSLQVFHSEASSTSAETHSEIRQVMLTILGAIYRAVQSVSASRSPTSNLYLIELFKVREVLYSEEAGHVTQLAGYLTKAKETLDNAIEDSYQLWSIPLVLDPRYKLKHIESTFKKPFGSKAAERIKEVADNIEDFYDRYYDDRPDGNEVPSSLEDFCDRYYDDDDRPEDINIILDDYSKKYVTQLKSYLNDSLACCENSFDVLKWWKEYGMNQYPAVAEMARDALAMPTCGKLSSEQTAQLGSIVRGYSKEA